MGVHRIFKFKRVSEIYLFLLQGKGKVHEYCYITRKHALATSTGVCPIPPPLQRPVEHGGNKDSTIDQQGPCIPTVMMASAADSYGGPLLPTPLQPDPISNYTYIPTSGWTSLLLYTVPAGAGVLCIQFLSPHVPKAVCMRGWGGRTHPGRSR